MRNPNRETYGESVAHFADALGKPLMPWQRHVADVALEVNPDTGRLSYRRIVLTVPRQSGKTTLLLALFAQRALGFGSPQVMTYAAQSGVAARDKFVDEHLPILDSSILSTLYRKRLTNGHEAVLWKNGSRHHISAGTEKSGHGSTLDLAVVDEAFAQPDGRLEQAFSPALITRPQSQLWFVSTAGKPGDDFFRQKVEQGRSHLDSSRTAYFEWSAPDDADPFDRAVWRACMPALGHTINEDDVSAELDGMALDEFRRAYLNQWVSKGARSVIDAAVWAGCAQVNPEAFPPAAFALDVTPDRVTSSVAVAVVLPDGRTRVEVAESQPGTHWVAPWLSERCARWGVPVVVDPRSAAGSLLPELSTLRVPMVEVGAREYAQACGRFYDAATQSKLRHLDDPRLNAALTAAKTRPIGDAWGWARKDTTADISPLVAVTLALHGATAVEAAPSGGWVLAL